ncbi:MAG: Ribosomal protein S17 [Leptospirillum sp. Group IV 'UBA BS']|nr:MAG: Ribosomal protein S17 [Leptospirillum sp. Group IV 'UBA BS']
MAENKDEQSKSSSKSPGNLQGIVVKNKMTKTVVVEIRRKVMHPLYKKVVTKKNRLKAHTDISIPEGSTVLLAETRPISKDKHHRVVRVL